LARAVNLELVEVETNLREYSDRYVGWDDYHGAALAAVAHVLAPDFGRIYVPSTYGYAFLFPYGSHPGLDPLWGTDALALVHDGCEANRFEKIRALTRWDLALGNLRVCWQLAEGSHNCCRCRKCVWTMAFLRACGVLEQARSFGQSLDLDLLGRYPPTRADESARFLSALATVEGRGTDPDLAACLRAGLDRGRVIQRTERWAGTWARRAAQCWTARRISACGWKTSR
jgi:hypothetical protein